MPAVLRSAMKDMLFILSKCKGERSVCESGQKKHSDEMARLFLSVLLDRELLG
jgi:hypothetical protein